VSHGKERAKPGAGLVIAALGVVFGDLGTSPLYTVKEALGGPHGAPVEPVNVLGVMSLFFWSLMLVVVVKYTVLVMRADNRGEGGILALAALILPPGEARKRTRLPLLILLALFGCGLLFGDGIITPAISVLSSIEGLEVATPAVHPWILPITIGILVGLFAVQRYGTAKIGLAFGPIMLLWFAAIGAAAVPAIVRHPGIFRAINPYYAVRFFTHGGPKMFWVLGSIVLAVTGAEALYADMGHFGRSAIRRAWYWIVFPGVLLSYFGQCAYLLDHPHVEFPFFELVPAPLVVPMVILAAAATVVASQALITGVFSLTHQAVALGYLPRLTIVHTSADTEGQIYVPPVNAMLAVACIAVTIGFRSSSALAAAFGIAVSSTMAITTILMYRIARDQWKWSPAASLAVVAPLSIVDLLYTAANLRKLSDGGWLPLAIGLGAFAIMTTWWRGRHVLEKIIEARSVPDDEFLDRLATRTIVRTPGTGVFMTSNPHTNPEVLEHLGTIVKAVPEQVVLMTIVTEPRPWVPGNDCLELQDVRESVKRVTARIGFMQSANVPKLLDRARSHGLELDEAELTYYLGRNALVLGRAPVMWRWRKRLFSFLVRNASAPTHFFGLPADRTIEIGAQYEL
jgi:KUP system potassium uptake protein